MVDILFGRSLTCISSHLRCTLTIIVRTASARWHRGVRGRVSRRRPTLAVFPTVVQVILWAHLGPFYRQDAMSGDPSRAVHKHPPRPWEENKGQWKTIRREHKRETAVSNQDTLNDTMHLQPVCVCVYTRSELRFFLQHCAGGPNKNL